MFDKLKLKYTASNSLTIFLKTLNYFICYFISIVVVFGFLYLSYKDIIFPSLHVTDVHLNNIFMFSSKIFVNVIATILCMSRISNWITIKNHLRIKENGTKNIGEIIAVREEKVGFFNFKCSVVILLEKGRTIIVEGIVRDKNFRKIYETHGPQSVVSITKPHFFVDVYSQGFFESFVDFDSIIVK